MFLASDKLKKLNAVSSINEFNIQGASIDLSIGEQAKVLKTDKPINLFELKENENLLSDRFEQIDLAKGYELKPLSYLYASSAEKVKIPKNMCGLIMPRSTFARLGLILPISSYANPGYEGHLPIIIFNASGVGITIPPYIRIMQLIFCELNGEAIAYHSNKGAKYQNEIPLQTPILNDKDLENIFKNIELYNEKHK